jgi:uncharacterized protein DUF4389
MYPVRYEADYVEQQSRSITFFRALLILPWYIVGAVYNLGAQIVALMAWFALLFTGRYPQGFYDFNAGYLRFHARYSGFFLLQTDQWPPFGLEQDPSYPIRAEVDPPLEKYNRWKVFFRLILGFPVYCMLYPFGFVLYSASTIAWLHIVFMGRTSGGIHNALTTAQAYLLRSIAYFLLMTETLPPVSDQAPAGSLPPGAAVAATRTTATKA